MASVIKQAPVESSVSESCADKSAEGPLSVDSVYPIFDVSPEATEVDRLVDNTCYGILTDEKLKRFSELFKKIVTDNEMFKRKTNQEKADILYKFHSDEIISQLQGCEALNRISNPFFEKINASPETREATKEVVLKRALRSRIDSLHSGYARLAIATALGVPVEEIFVPHEDSLDISALKKPSNMEIYKQ